jgi:hypothetical protein
LDRAVLDCQNCGHDHGKSRGDERNLDGARSRVHGTILDGGRNGVLKETIAACGR